ncbi:response regulator [Roseimarinus sediminis]|uniref:response regulator n=1 Tax=Roseimarinus sediminis TaxID=1610899 RepID=UPI003D253661
MKTQKQNISRPEQFMVYQRLFEEKDTVNIVIVDDDEYFNRLLRYEIEKVRFDLPELEGKIGIHSYVRGNSFLQDLSKESFTDSNIVLFVDYSLEENLNGLKIMHQVRQFNPDSVVVLMSEFRTRELSLASKEAGVFAFLKKDRNTPAICRILIELLLVAD